MVTEVYKNRYKLFTVGAIGTFMATLDGSILNVALPTISADLNCSVDTVAWVVLAYSLTLISLMLVFGVWTDRKGYSFGYRFGFYFFIVGSIICAISQTFYLLVFGRVVQAIGTAMFAAIGPGMVTTVFGAKERGKGIGMMVMMVSAGFMVGPPLGGFLLGFFPWQSIFIINIPIGFAGMYMTYRYFKYIPIPETKRPLRINSAVTMSLAMFLLTIGLTFINDYELNDPRIWGTFFIAIVSLMLFFKFERNPSTAIIGLDIFKNRQFTSSLTAMLFMFISNAGILILVPFYLENIMSYQPSQVGLFLIIYPIMMFIFAPLSGWLSDKIGYRILTVSGILILMFGYYMFTQLEIDSSALFIILCLVVVGMGVGIFNTPNSSAFMGSVEEKDRAVTSSILATTRNIGMSVGVALSTTLFAFFQTRYLYLGDESLAFVESYQIVIFVSIGVAAVSLAASMVRGTDSKSM
jgi:EmrB/QacA subfamily drug resistance transporter